MLTTSSVSTGVPTTPAGLRQCAPSFRPIRELRSASCSGSANTRKMSAFIANVAVRINSWTIDVDENYDHTCCIFREFPSGPAMATVAVFETTMSSVRRDANG